VRYARAKVKQGIINLKENQKGVNCCTECNRVNTTNGGGGAGGGSGSAQTILPQEAKHIIKRVSTKNTENNYSEAFALGTPSLLLASLMWII